MELGQLGELVAGAGDADGDLLGGVGLSSAQAVDHFIRGGRCQKNGHGAGHADAHRLCALHIHPHDDILARSQRPCNLAHGHALVVAVDEGIFEQLITVDHVGKPLHADEVVVLTVNLVGPGYARGCSDDAVETNPERFQGIERRVLADARWTRQDHHYRPGSVGHPKMATGVDCLGRHGK